MPALKGRDFILKQGDGATSETFTAVAGLRATGLSIDGETVDVTTKDSVVSDVLWRELMAGGGIRTMSLSADGVYLDDTTQKDLADLALSGALTNFQLADGSRTWEGAFQVTNFSQDGPHTTEQTFSVTLESHGEVAAT